MWTFFYGSYMNFSVLEEVNLIPDQWEVARLNGFDIRIQPRANLVRSDQQCVYGILATTTHQELSRLYAHARDVLGETYLPEAVLVETLDGQWKPALCYIAPSMEPQPVAHDYLDRILGPAKEFGFPGWYLARLESFRPQKLHQEKLLETNLEIRQIHLQDAASLAGLLRSLDTVPHFQNEDVETTTAQVYRHLTQCLEDTSHSMYVAVSPDGSVVGYGAVHWLPYLFLSGPEGFVSELFIHQAARGLGLGTRLLSVIEAEAKMRGCSRLQLINLRSAESYKRGFYEKAGWRERVEVADFVFLLSGK